MKISKLLTGVIALIAFSFSPAAMADEEGATKERPAGDRGKGRPGGPGGPGGFDRTEMMKKLDTDGDGKLSEDERLVGMKERLANSEEMKKRLLERFDEDKDGELSDAELKKAMAAFGERRPGGRPGGEGKPGERPERKPGERPERKPKAEAGE